MSRALLVCLAALFGCLSAQAAEGLRIATSLAPGDPVYGALGVLAAGSREITQAEPAVRPMEEAPTIERSRRALKLLLDGQADLAVVDLSEIANKPILSYALQPFLAKDVDAARQLDLSMRREIARILEADLKITLLGTMPQLPRVVLLKQPSWNGTLFLPDVVAPTETEALGLMRLGITRARAAPHEKIGSAVAAGASLGIVSLALAESAARANGLWIYDVRASYPVLAVLSTSAALGRFPKEQREALIDLVRGVEALAWERIDRVAEGVIERAKADKAPVGELTAGIGENFGKLVATSLQANAQRSVSEVVARNSQMKQQQLKASGDDQVYGTKCRNLEILLVTNRALATGTRPGPDGTLPRRGAELLASLAPALQYGVAEVQVPARSFDPPTTLGACREADGRNSTDKGVTLLHVRLLDRKQFVDLAARTGSGFAPGAPFLVFVHGYRVDFRAAVETAARLSGRMRNAMRPVLLSWPSAGRLLGYGDDGKMAAASPSALQAALETLAAVPGKRPIGLVAHSMGNRVALDALDAMRKAGRNVVVDELATVAPDVQCQKYVAIMGGLGGTVRRATLYLFEDDYALKASKQYWALNDRSEICRMGSQRGPAAAGIGGLDPVDWSCINVPVDTHSYYVADDYIARDLRETVLAHRNPVDRDLEPMKVPPSGRYYLHLGSLDRGCAGVK